eukprot:SAG31_NODE_315_length_17848_cov_18.145811_8_plen_863_part_00
MDSLILRRNRSLSTPAQREIDQALALTDERRAVLSQRYGTPAVSEIEVRAREIFAEVAKDGDGLLELPEFARTLGILGARSAADGRRGLAAFMFAAVDVDDSGHIGFSEFVHWQLTMLCGAPEERLRFGFDLCDFNRDGTITRHEIGQLVASMFAVLSGLQIGDGNPEVEAFLDQLFSTFGDGGVGGETPSTLNWEQYRRACLECGAEISHLGHRKHAPTMSEKSTSDQPADLPSGQQKQMGTKAFFGQERWELMLTVMIGVQLAVEGSASVDESDSKELTMRSTEIAESFESMFEASVPERAYPIPSAQSSRRTANDTRCRALVWSAIAIGDADGGTAAVTELVAAATDVELWDSLGRMLKSRLSELSHHDASTEAIDALKAGLRTAVAVVQALPPANFAASAAMSPLKSFASKVATSCVPKSHMAGNVNASVNAVHAASNALVTAIDKLMPATVAKSKSSWFKRNVSPKGSGADGQAVAATSQHLGASITVIGGQLFREIRETFGVSEADFLGALGIRQVIGGLLMGDLRGLAEMVSEGKSGSLFFWSHDGKFMIKTIDEDERDSLRNMLRAYHAYVSTHRDTLIAKYLGLYDLTVQSSSDASKTTVHHMVVMANVFWTQLPIDERFDLKGSSFKRTVGEKKRGAAGLVHKDLDFDAMERVIGLPSNDLAAALKTQIEQDAAFLSMQGCIDYSLLVGVARELPPWRGDNSQERWIHDNTHTLRQAHELLNPSDGSLTEILCTRLDFDTFAKFAASHRSPDLQTSNASDAEPTNESGSKFARYHGGMQGWSHRDVSKPINSVETLFCGIIDVLVPFNFKKQAEFRAKSVLQRGQNFSVIPPHEYASRFIESNTSRISIWRT